MSTVLGGGGQEDLEPDLSAATCCQQLCTVDLDPGLVSRSPQTEEGRDFQPYRISSLPEAAAYC